MFASESINWFEKCLNYSGPEFTTKDGQFTWVQLKAAESLFLDDKGVAVGTI